MFKHDSASTIMRYILLTTLIVSISSVSYGQQKSESIDETEMNPLQLVDIAEAVSIVQLIATPKKYHSKRMQVIGYLHLEFEGDAIYLHKEDYDNSIDANALWVNFSDKLEKKKNTKDYSDEYVIILGTFNMNDKGHMGLFRGTFDNIVRLDKWPMH
jgi:hypothetical protein